MKPPSHRDAYQVLLLQAADEGRGPILFGDSFERARYQALPFLVGQKMPSVYLEHPLIGDPFLDVTLLYNKLGPNTRIASDMAQGSEAMLDWFHSVYTEDEEICCGFELDTKNPSLPQAAVHFQPRTHLELVKPFCEAVDEPDRAKLYLDLAARMPKGWPLSFFGLFKGRPEYPLRACGYMDFNEKNNCADDPQHIATCFDQIGFCAYDKAMLDELCSAIQATPGAIDFQFDVFPDGSLGSTFAIDTQFKIEQPEVVQDAFENGNCSGLMALLEAWNIADERWRLSIASTFARAIPVELEDGTLGRFAFALMPQWAKVRWSKAVLQPSKLYLLAKAGPAEAS